MLHVYIDKISNYKFSTDVYPSERLSEILSCKSEKVKLQKYASWKLLEKALNLALNLDFNELNFAKTKQGKWECDKAYFSISHSNNLVCVAVASSPVGVDIEKIKSINPLIKNKILTNDELKIYRMIDKEDKNDYLLSIFSGKESAYKFSNELPFYFDKINLSNYPITTQKLSIDNEDYYVSVCFENIDKINIKITLP